MASVYSKNKSISLVVPILSDRTGSVIELRMCSGSGVYHKAAERAAGPGSVELSAGCVPLPRWRRIPPSPRQQDRRGRPLSPAGDGRSPPPLPPPARYLNCRRDIQAGETGVLTSTCNLPDFYLRRETMSTCQVFLAISQVFLYLGRTLWSTRVSCRRPAVCSALRSSWSLNSRRSGDRPVCCSRKMLSERSSRSDWAMFSRGTVSMSL